MFYLCLNIIRYLIGLLSYIKTGLMLIGHSVIGFIVLVVVCVLVKMILELNNIMKNQFYKHSRTWKKHEANRLNSVYGAICLTIIILIATIILV